VLVTSEGLKYMMVRNWDVDVGKRVMPQAIIVGSDPRSLAVGESKWDRKASGTRNGYPKPFTVYYNNVIKQGS
jgi:hypothetical protein